MPQPTEQISLDKAYEVRHWTRTLGWTEPELYAAVKAVGKGLEELRQHRANMPRKSQPPPAGSGPH